LIEVLTCCQFDLLCGPRWEDWALKPALKKAILGVLKRTIELQRSHKQILIKNLQKFY